MTFENHTRGEMHEQRKSENDAKIVEKESKPGPSEDRTDGDDALAKKTGQPGETVGLIGGQPIGDTRGLDVSHYTGPKTQASSQFDDPQAPYHQGPGSGLSEEEKSESE